jgi:hypothetical protein
MEIKRVNNIQNGTAYSNIGGIEIVYIDRQIENICTHIIT